VADISRADALALINQQNMNEIWQNAAVYSAALRSFRQVPMSTKQAKLRVVDALPTAFWVTGDSGRKQTSDMAWANKFLEVEELAVIVPIPDAVLEDTDADLWGEVRPRTAEAIGFKIDQAVFFGTDKPASWPNSLEDGARAAGNVYLESTAGDIVEDINQTLAIVEDDGFDPDVMFARKRLRTTLRGLRDSTGQPVLVSFAPGGTMNRRTWEVYDVPLETVDNGAWVDPSGGPPSTAGARLITGSRRHAIIGMRSDITFEFSNEATLTDGAGAVVMSLWEQDMTAMRVRIRLAFQVADPTTIQGGSGAYPFAILA